MTPGMDRPMQSLAPESKQETERGGRVPDAGDEIGRLGALDSYPTILHIIHHTRISFGMWLTWNLRGVASWKKATPSSGVLVDILRVC